MHIFATLFTDYVKMLLLAAAVFIPFERFAGAQPTQQILRRGSAVDALTGLLNTLLLYVVLVVVLVKIDALAAATAPNLRIWVESRPFWAQAVLAVAVGDLGIYIVHRVEHTVPWLWRFHAIHHSAEELDWLVAFRNHPVDLLLFRVASLGPLVALHVSAAALGFFVAVTLWQSWLNHANVQLRYGPLRWVFASPEFHHWHHCTERQCHDSNYAGLLPGWDLLFGTLYLPRGRQPLHYGTDEPIPPGYVNRLFHPFRSNARRAVDV